MLECTTHHVLVERTLDMHRTDRYHYKIRLTFSNVSSGFIGEREPNIEIFKESLCIFVDLKSNNFYVNTKHKVYFVIANSVTPYYGCK